jgi:hypothetical protein
MLRQLFLSFAFSIIGFGVVLAALYSGSSKPTDPPTTLAFILLVVASGLFVVGTRAEQPLNCGDDHQLAGSYRTRFFLRMAFANVPAFFGFVGFFLTYAWWPFPLGAGITAIGFVRAAPTANHLARDQEALSAASCYRSLIAALRRPPPRSRPS